MFIHFLIFIYAPAPSQMKVQRTALWENGHNSLAEFLSTSGLMLKL